MAVLFVVTLTTIYQLPRNYSFETGRQTVEPFFQGFYGTEKNDKFAYRWSQPRLTLNLPYVGQRAYDVTLTGLSLKPAPVSVKDASARQITLLNPTRSLESYRFRVPAEAVAGGNLKLVFETEGFQPPGGSDQRWLGLLVTKFELAGENVFVLPPWDLLLAGLAGSLAIYWLLLRSIAFLSGRWRQPFWLAPGLGLAIAAGLGWISFASLDLLSLVTRWLGWYLPGAAATILIFELAALPVAFYFSRRPAAEPTALEPAPEKAASLPVSQPVDYLKRYSGLLLLLVALLAGVLRFINLLETPIFLDEVIHIKGGQAAQSGQLNQQGLLMLARDGRFLHGWLLAALYNLFNPQDLLLWARLLSAISGVVTTLVCYKLGEKLFSVRAGLLAAACWAILPYTLWHERLALVDPLMTSLTGLMLYFGLRLLEVRPGWPVLVYGLLTGLALAFSTLIKLPGLLVGFAPLLTLLCLYPPRKWSKLLPRLGPVYAVFWLTALPIIMLSETFWNSVQQEQQISSFNPALLFSNLAGSVEWFYSYLTPGLLLLTVVGLAWAIIKNWEIAFLLLSTFLAPMLVISGMGGIFFPRYLLFILVPLIVLAMGGVDKLYANLKGKLKPVLLVLALLCLVPVFWFNYRSISNPVAAPLPGIDRFQYIEGWASGTGIKEMVNFVNQEKGAQTPLILAGDPVAYDDLKIYLHGRPDWEVIGTKWPNDVNPKKINRSLGSGRSAYFLILDPSDRRLLQEYQKAYPNIRFKLAHQVHRPGNHFQLQLYRLHDSSANN